MPWHFFMTVGPMRFADHLVDYALQLNNQALRTLADRRGSLSDRGVHLLRVSVKRLRACWKLLRGAVAEEVYVAAISRLRDVHHQLADARDATVMLETLERLEETTEDERAKAAFAELAAGLSGNVVPHVMALPLPRISASFQEESRAWRELALLDDAPDALIEGYVRCYRKGRRMGRDAVQERKREDLHAWRRWVKITLHQLDIIKPALGERNLARRWYLGRLGDTLGTHNDCAMLRQRLGHLQVKRREQECIVIQLDQRMDASRARAIKLYRHVYEDTPHEFGEGVREDIARLDFQQNFLLPRSA